MIKIPLLPLQPALRQHIPHIQLSAYQPIPIKTLHQLHQIHPLILPTTHSTTLPPLIHLYPFKQKLQQLHLPIFRTCPPLILLPKNLQNHSPYLNKLHITVHPNSFATQLHTFQS
ncbi:type 1 glutamine amidotransferase family protein, partial [Staphylococcus epidermidis]